MGLKSRDPKGLPMAHAGEWGQKLGRGSPLPKKYKKLLTEPCLFTLELPSSPVGHQPPAGGPPCGESTLQGGQGFRGSEKVWHPLAPTWKCSQLQKLGPIRKDREATKSIVCFFPACLRLSFCCFLSDLRFFHWPGGLVMFWSSVAWPLSSLKNKPFPGPFFL